MVEFKKILFPVDLSAVYSPGLVEHVLTMANKFSAELHVLHVVRAYGPYYGGDYIPSPRIEAYQFELIGEVQKKLEAFVAEHMGGYTPLRMAVISGHTAREILKYIADNNISLVIMGTHGRRGLDKVIFGSVAQRVVQSSPVPVVTLNPYLEAEAQT